MIRCMAIDDEPLALRQIKSYIDRIESAELVAMCSNAIEAEQVLAEQSIDVMFVDINMPDVNGLDFVRGLKSAPMVIFTTAYSEYALEGYRLDAVDYLLKPFSFEDFKHATKKAASLSNLFKMRREKLAAEGEIEKATESERPSDDDYISIKADYKVSLIKCNTIIYAESVGEYVRLHLTDGTTITTLYRLKNMESMLAAYNFMRVHRSYIVNLSRVASYTRGRIYLDNGDYVPVSLNYRASFRNHLASRK